MKMFEVGRTYRTRSIGDHNCIFTAEVLKRTAKTVTVKLDGGKIVKRGLSEWNGAEMFFPHGRYSMAAIIRADREEV